MLVKVKGKLQFAESSKRAGFLQQFSPSAFTITQNQYVFFLTYWFFVWIFPFAGPGILLRQSDGGRGIGFSPFSEPGLPT
jgi:hypothetical protein